MARPSTPKIITLLTSQRWRPDDRRPTCLVTPTALHILYAHTHLQGEEYTVKFKGYYEIPKKVFGQAAYIKPGTCTTCVCFHDKTTTISKQTLRFTAYTMLSDSLRHIVTHHLMAHQTTNSQCEAQYPLKQYIFRYTTSPHNGIVALHLSTKVLCGSPTDGGGTGC